jgi:hypothetical protein
VFFLAVRSYRSAQAPDERAAALVGLAAMVIVAIQTYGDLGQYSVQWPLFVALSLAVVGKLAVATGAWPRRLRFGERLAVAHARAIAPDGASRG